MPSGRPPTYPFDSLALGESFTIPATEHRGYGRVQQYVYQRNFVLKPKRFSCLQAANGDIVVSRRS